MRVFDATGIVDRLAAVGNRGKKTNPTTCCTNTMSFILMLTYLKMQRVTDLRKPSRLDIRNTIFKIWNKQSSHGSKNLYSSNIKLFQKRLFVHALNYKNAISSLIQWLSVWLVRIYNYKYAMCLATFARSALSSLPVRLHLVYSTLWEGWLEPDPLLDPCIETII